MIKAGETEIPEKCPKTGGELLHFSEVVKKGLNCPYCGESLFQSRWFTSEV